MKLIGKMLSRRTLLSGLGTAVSIPLLDAMVPASVRAAAGVSKGTRAAGKPPTRLGFVYVPNGVNMKYWRPAEQGAKFQLPRSLEPLKPVKDDLLVLTGLAQDNGRALGDGPGDHARALSTWLTGEHPVKTAGANIKVGVSVDQVGAAKIGQLTRLPSLELGCDKGQQAGNCDSGYSCAYSTNLSWKTPTLPMAKEVNPALVFDRLFGSGVDPKRDKQKQSILDFVREDLESLKGRLGGPDKRKVDEYLSSVRELEQRIARFGTMPAVAPPAFGRPEGTPQDNLEHVRLMADLMVLAFQSDVTRIATFVLTNEGSNKNYPQLEVPDGHHDLSHHGGNPEKLEKIARINTFHVTQLGYLLEKLKSIKDGDGTLLDHAMIAYGSSLGDGDRHNHDDLPILVAGRGGGTIKTGRHIVYPHTPLNNLWLSLLDRVGAATDKVGDSTGRLGSLGG